MEQSARWLGHGTDGGHRLSAFPGFFPAARFRPEPDVGAPLPASSAGKSYADGGVFDNLGVRMFRFLEQLLPPDHGGLDGVLVSDVGKRIEVKKATAARAE